MSDAIGISRLRPPAAEADVRSLAGLLRDAVGSGAAVSFLSSLTPERAECWWRDTLRGDGIVLVARREGRIVGTVQAQRAWAPNQPHRAEVCKLLVHSAERRAGVGAALMRAIEAEARAEGLTLLTLDAKAGGDADRLYRRLGWACVGTIPGFALDPDGITPHDAVIFYKRIAE